MPGLVEVNSRQLMNDKSDLTASAELLLDAQLYVDKIKAQMARRKVDQWNVSDCLCPVQVFPKHVIFICAV